MGCGAGRAGRSGAPRQPRRPFSARQVARGPGARPASALRPGRTRRNRSRRRRHSRGGTARFAEGVKCLKYGGGSESPRTPPPAPSSPRPSQPLPLPASPAGFPEDLLPAPEPPYWPPRFPPGCGWKLERKPESCPLRRSTFPPARSQGEERSGETTPRRPAGSSLTGKKFV